MLTIDLYDDVITFSEPDVMRVVHIMQVAVNYKGFFAKAGFLVLKPADGSGSDLCFSSGWNRFNEITGQVECYVYQHKDKQWIGDWCVVDNCKPPLFKEYLIEWTVERLEGDTWQSIGGVEDISFGDSASECMRALLVHLSCQKHGVIRENCGKVYFKELDEYGNPAQYRYTDFRIIWEGSNRYD